MRGGTCRGYLAGDSVAYRVIPVTPDKIAIETARTVAPDAPARGTSVNSNGDHGSDMPPDLSLPSLVPAPDVAQIPACRKSLVQASHQVAAFQEGNLPHPVRFLEG
jgi:hypothetical protein